MRKREASDRPKDYVILGIKLIAYGRVVVNVPGGRDSSWPFSDPGLVDKSGLAFFFGGPGVPELGLGNEESVKGVKGVRATDAKEVGREKNLRVFC